MGTAYWAGGTSTDTNTAANWVDTANGTHASNPFQRGGVDAVPNNADDVIIQSTSNSNVDRNPTQNAAHTFNSLVLESGSQWTADGTNHLTLDGEDANDFALRITEGTFVHSNGTIVINNGGGGIAHAAIQAGNATSTNGIYDLTISGGGTTCEIYGDTTIHRNMEAGGSTTVLRGALTVNGNLTVEGTLNTRYSSTDRDLTVLGALDVGSSGALTCNSSAVQCNGLRTTGGTVNLPDASGSFTVKGTEFSGYGIFDRVGSGNIVHNSGTVTWDTGGTSTMYALSTFNNIATTTSGTTLRWFSALTLAGTLTVAANTTVHEHSSAGGAFTVGGNVSVEGTLGDSSAYSAYEFGSLYINNGGTYNATSGTTTIDDINSSSGNRSFRLHTGGTFTHNKGKFLFNKNGDQFIGSTPSDATITFYDLEVSSSGSAAKQIRDMDLKVLNNLTVGANCNFTNEQSGDIITVLGQSILNGKIDVNAAGGSHHLGAMTINSGGEFKVGSTTNYVTSLRNVGGTVTQV